MDDTVEGAHRLVHLDLKGAPPRISYYEQLFPLVSSFGATGLLVEYEDMFPYHGKVAHLRAPHAYSPEDIEKLHILAAKNNLIIIPLVQTFGHFEFILKHDENRAVREIERYPNALCPTHPDAFPLVAKILSQVWHIGKCPRCQDEMDAKKMSTNDLFLAWVFKVAWWIKKEYPHLTIVMWDDMMRNISLERLKSSGIGELVEPMVWQYQAKKFDLPPDIFIRYSAVFNGIWLASAFKGATGSTQFLPPIQHHINNHLTWIAVLAEYKHQFKIYRGIALTGWQRYDHYAVLCELLPVALPCLCLCLRVITHESFTEADHDYVSQKMSFPHRINVVPFPRPQVIEQCISYPGHKIYVGVQMWSNFVCKYQAISNSEGMLGWFSDYLRSRNFTNPVQVENIMNPIIEVLENLTELRTHLIPWMLEVFYEDTVEEWVGSFIDPLVEKLKSVIEECRKQILIGGRVRDYKKIEY
ncbi:Hexosaminidase D-like 2 [Homarus americanus]|uniref:Hexosaminidase D-like 2 n=1 Tax=Homarus americanus TaxID=6706 RepID=A0A8J5MXR9_HOMAM|nr:Hexosaminidase D-like 2 [Homarus americanus]